MRDAIRGYLALASGLTEVTRQKATAAARALLNQGEATADQVGAIAEDLVSTSLSNRAALVNIVRLEVARARSAMGMATSSELDALTRRVTTLESELAAPRGVTAPAAGSGQPPGSGTTMTQAPPAATAKKTAAKKTAAKKTAAKKTAAKATKATTATKATAAAKAIKATKARKSQPGTGTSTKPSNGSSQ